MSAPNVTIVLCTRNRARMLDDALSSLAALETAGFEFEILVVDNGSTDDTAKVVAAAAAEARVAIRCASEPHPGVAFARNRGVIESRGQWLAFFDDDQLAHPRWLIELLAMAHAKNVRCVGGAVHLKLPAGQQRNLSPFCRLLLGETTGMTEPRMYSFTVTPGAGNLMLQRSVFDEVGLFNETLNTRGEDTELFLRIHARGIEAWYTPAAMVSHVIPPERLSDRYLMSISRLMVRGMADDERRHWGRALFPLVWAARSMQALFLLIPRLAWAHVRRDHERTLGARCRLRLAQGYLSDGLELIVPGISLRRSSDC
ncbi:MAG: glycosyltransferase family A protein [Planctomycetaceae bacterium]